MKKTQTTIDSLKEKFGGETSITVTNYNDKEFIFKIDNHKQYGCYEGWPVVSYEIVKNSKKLNNTK